MTHLMRSSLCENKTKPIGREISVLYKDCAFRFHLITKPFYEQIPFSFSRAHRIALEQQHLVSGIIYFFLYCLSVWVAPMHIPFTS